MTLEELYLDSYDSFILGQVMDENENWLLVKTYDELGHQDSVQLLDTKLVAKRIADSPYLRFYQHLISRRTCHQENFPLHEANLKASLALLNNQLISLFTENDIFFGKLQTKPQLSISEFNWETFTFGQPLSITPIEINRLIWETKDSLLKDYLQQLN